MIAPIRWRRSAAPVIVVVALVAVAATSGVLTVRGATIVVGAVTTGAFVRLLVVREGTGSAGPFSRLMAAPPVGRPAASDVRRLEDQLALSATTVGDAHRLLRPVLRDVAEEWLLSARGVGLTDPSAAEQLPPGLWAVIRPDARRPENPHGPGFSADHIGRLIGELEELR